MGYYMKKISFRKSFFTCLSGAVLFITVLLFTSCENFLKGANVRQELEEAIEIANASPVTYYVIADQGSGTVTPNQLRLKKKESFDIMFVPNDDWKFICWEVLDRDSGEVVEDSIKFADAKALETKGTVLATRENLSIHPKCIKLPAVVSHTPSVDTEKNYANTPIILNFNMELDEENFAEGGVFSNYDFITLSCSGSPVTNLFEKPVLNDNKTSITLMSKPAELAYYIKEEKKALYIDINVGFKNDTNILIGGQSSPMAGSVNFLVRFIPTTEREAPIEADFYACRPDDQDTHYCIENDILDDNDKLMQNRTKGKVFIYGKFSDEESGVKYVEVKEQLKSDTWKNFMVGTEYSKKYTSETLGVTFVTEGSNTEFFIEYELQSGTGVIQMEVTVYDACMNAAPVKSFTVIKVSAENYYFTTGTNQDKFLFDVYNYWGMNRLYCYDEGTYFSSSNYNNYHKTLFVTDTSEPDETGINILIETLYGTMRVPKDKFTIVCEYVDDSGKLVPGEFQPPQSSNDPFDSYWTYTLQNVEKVSGLEVLVRVTDDIGNSVERTFKFLPEPQIVLTKNKYDEITPVFFYDKLYDNDVDTTDAWYIETNTTTQEKKYYIYCPTLKDNCTYQVIPQLNSLLGEISSTSFTKATYMTDTSDKINWAGDPVYSKGNKLGELLATVSIANGSWSNHDIIYCRVQGKDSLSGTTKGIDDFYFTKPQTSMTIPIPTDTAYSRDIIFTLYGVKGNALSDASDKKTKTNLNEADSTFEFDNSYPTATVTQITLDTFNFNLTDSGSGPLSASVKKSNGKEYVIADEDKGFSIPGVESWILKEYGSSVILKDKKGNTTTQTYTLPAPATCKISSITRITEGSGLGKWKLNTNGSSSGYKFTFYKWNNGAWEKITSPGGTYALDIRDVFVKIEYHNKDGLNRLSWGTPQYFYFNDAKNTGQFDYFEPCNDESLFVTSDAPAYVETIITTKPYDECIRWTKDEWERFHKKRGGTLLEFPASENPVRRKYNIPLSEINSGECYVVIAHFADGTSFMTEVREKP